MVRSSARKYGKPRISGNLSLYKAKAQLLSMAASKPKPKRVYCQGCGTLVGDGHEHTASDGTVWSPS